MRPDLLEKIENILAVLDAASGPDKMDLPSFRLHPLKGKLRGFWAVTVRANWRIIWRFEGTDAAEVDETRADVEPSAPWPDCSPGVP